jgi:hypothetical protein
MKYLYLENLSKSQKNYINIFNSSNVIKKETLFHCPLCKSKNLKKLFTNDRYRIKCITVFCKECSLVFQNPRMKISSLKYFYASSIYRGIYNKDYISEATNSYKHFQYQKKKYVLKNIIEIFFLIISIVLILNINLFVI